MKTGNCIKFCGDTPQVCSISLLLVCIGRNGILTYSWVVFVTAVENGTFLLCFWTQTGVEKFMDGLQNSARSCIDYIKLDCRMLVSKATVFFRAS